MNERSFIVNTYSRVSEIPNYSPSDLFRLFLREHSSGERRLPRGSRQQPALPHKRDFDTAF